LPPLPALFPYTTLFRSSGAAFFTGTALLLAGLLFVTYSRRKVLPAIGRMILLGGLFCVVMSATPLPAWVWCVWGTTFVAWAACVDRKSTRLNSSHVKIS